jgi:Potential Monad-binding region of RPAP3
MDDMVTRALKPKTTTEDIIKLSRSDVVTSALIASVQTPQTGSQFERDYKSFKADTNAKLEYLLKTVRKDSVIKNIFKSNLETDILIDIVKTFSDSLKVGESPSEMALDIAEFLKSTCECWPFEIAVEFLSTSERSGK